MQGLRSRHVASQAAANRDQAFAQWAADDHEEQTSTASSLTRGENDAWLDDFAGPREEMIGDRLELVDAAISSWAEKGRDE